MNIVEKLDKVIEDWGLRKPLYYYRPEEGASVCLFIDRNGTAIARGVAICSPFDNYDKAIGRTIALCRALRAIKKETDTEGINPSRFDEHRSFYPRGKEYEASCRLKWASYVYTFKSVFCPKLTEFEWRLVDGTKAKACA